MSWASRTQLVSILDDWKRRCNPILCMPTSNTVSGKWKRKNYQ